MTEVKSKRKVEGEFGREILQHTQPKHTQTDTKSLEKRSLNGAGEQE